MQSVGELVEFGEARRHTARDTALRGDGIDLVHRRLQKVFQRKKVLSGPALRHVIDLGLRAVHNLVDIGALGAA